MAHPLMYLLGNTQERSFPLILVIGREPNYDDNLSEFRSMSGGVWVTAYTQLAKQYIGSSATARQLKELCFEKHSSPIVFTNAFPVGIKSSVNNKVELRDKLMSKIPRHIASIFSKSIIKRVKLVIQHGAEQTESSLLATQMIKEECLNKGITYCKTPFFYNANSYEIQSILKEQQVIINDIFSDYETNA